MRSLSGAALAMVCLLFAPPAAGATPEVFLLSSLERIDPGGVFVPKRGLSLYAARGECESFQVVIRPRKRDLRNVRLAISGFRNRAGQAISAGNVTLYFEHWVDVRYGTPNQGGGNRPIGPGRYPDPLAPAGRGDGTLLTHVARGEVAVVWADVLVPRDAPAGRYHAAVTLTADGIRVTRPLSLEVWRFQLPLRPALRSSFGMLRMSKANSIELLRHRLMPKRTEPADERELIREWGLTSTNLGVWARTSRCGARSPAPGDAIGEKTARHERDLLLFNYTLDEVAECPGLEETIWSWARTLHAHGVLQLMTIPPTPRLLGTGAERSAVDIWVVLPVAYDRSLDLIRHALAKGDRVWSYNMLIPDSYSPKWQIDFAPLNYRLQPGFLNHVLGLTGLLYWQVDHWTGDPWRDVDSHKFGPAHLPGEGMLVYPGKPAGCDHVVPSMRLKWLRDGVDDFDYLVLLSQSGEGQWASKCARTVASSWSSWTRDPRVIEAARVRLGRRLDRLSTLRSPETAAAAR